MIALNPCRKGEKQAHGKSGGTVEGRDAALGERGGGGDQPLRFHPCGDHHQLVHIAFGGAAAGTGEPGGGKPDPDDDPGIGGVRDNAAGGGPGGHVQPVRRVQQGDQGTLQRAEDICAGERRADAGGRAGVPGLQGVQHVRATQVGGDRGGGGGEQDFRQK